MMKLKTKRYISSATRMALFECGELQLTHDEYDVYAADLIQLLEDSRDQAYLLRSKEEASDRDPGEPE